MQGEEADPTTVEVGRGGSRGGRRGASGSGPGSGTSAGLEGERRVAARVGLRRRQHGGRESGDLGEKRRDEAGRVRILG